MIRTSIDKKVVLGSLVGVLTIAGCDNRPDAERIGLGAMVYATHCSSCHGAKREGQPNWKDEPAPEKRAAPPLDDSGEAWRYKDRQLFTIVKNGYVPPYAKPGRQSDMPGFRDRLSNKDIHAVLDYIRASWSEETKKKRAELLIKRRRH